MSISNVQQAFEEFEKRAVRVPDSENKAAKQVHPEFRQAVKDHLGARFEKSFLAGSYARRTQAVHLKDLDVVVVLNEPDGQFRASASGTLAAMKAAAASYPPVGTITTKCRAVECQLDGYPFWVDLVPALRDGHGGLLLAYVTKDGKDEWRSADPEGQTAACSAKNAKTGDLYVPVTRICKFWNGSFTSSPDQQKPLPSYLVEAILYDAVNSPMDWADAVLAFFERAQQHLSNPNPSVPCPGSSTEHVDKMLDDDRRQKALAKVEVALRDAREASQETDPAKAMDAWVKVFGSSFPAPSTHPSLIAQAVRNNNASVASTGVVAGASGRPRIPARSHGPARP